MIITIDTHNCSREEAKELKKYLEKNCWDFKTNEKELDSKYILSENKIYIIHSNEVAINKKIFDEELFEYRIIDRKDFIDNLIRWISEAKESDKILMKQDLEMLMQVEDDYIFSSISTNDYIYVGCSDFDNTCEKLLKLNNSIS